MNKCILFIDGNVSQNSLFKWKIDFLGGGENLKSKILDLESVMSVIGADMSKKSAREIVAELSAQYGPLNLGRATEGVFSRRLVAGVAVLDQFLEGGLPFGSLSEFGMPLGKEGRLLLLKYLVTATRGIDMNPLWTLWVSSFSEYQVFPPAWFAKGVDPNRIVFAESEAPVRDLKRAILNPFFKLIVFDSPRTFSKDDCHFLDQQARRNDRVAIVLRNYFLSNQRGNIWARLRLNCWKRHASNQFVIRVIRGLSRRELLLDEELLEWSDQRV